MQIHERRFEMWHWCFSLQRCILHHGCFTLRRLIDFRLVANLFTRICSVYRIILWQRALIKVASMLLWLFEQNLRLRSSVNNWSPTNWSSNLWSCYMKLWCDISWRATNLYGKLFDFTLVWAIPRIVLNEDLETVVDTNKLLIH